MMSASTLERRLDKHLLACAAAAVAVGAVAEDALAAINYSGPQNISVVNNFFGIYLKLENNTFVNGASGAGLSGWDLNVFSYNYAGAYPYVATFRNTGTQVMGTGTYVAKLSSGNAIGPGGPFTTSSVGTMVFGSPPFPGPQWGPNQTGFIGIQFVNDDATVHFGWVRATIGAQPPANGFYPLTIVDWAWETQPNTPINAGATGGNTTPEPSSAALGLLAIGALGSRMWRKTKAA